MSEKYTNTRTCREDEVPEWAKNGGQRQSEEYALLWGHRVRLVFVDEVPYWLKARKYTEVSGAVTGVVEV